MLLAGRYHAASEAEPRAIFGTTLTFWGRADYVTLSSGAVSALIDRTGQQDLAQATASKQPTPVIGGLGRPAIRGDATDDILRATLTNTIAGRSYMWVVATARSLPAATVYGAQTWVTTSTTQHLVPIRMTTTNFTAVCGSTDGTDIITGPARDTNAHLFELGFETTSTGRYVVDGTAYNGTKTGGPLNGATNRITLLAFTDDVSESNWGPFDIYESGLTNALPSTQQRLSLRDYVRRRYRITIA